MRFIYFYCYDTRIQYKNFEYGTKCTRKSKQAGKPTHIYLARIMWMCVCVSWWVSMCVYELIQNYSVAWKWNQQWRWYTPATKHPYEYYNTFIQRQRHIRIHSKNANDAKMLCHEFLTPSSHRVLFRLSKSYHLQFPFRLNHIYQKNAFISFNFSIFPGKYQMVQSDL